MQGAGQVNGSPLPTGAALRPHSCAALWLFPPEQKVVQWGGVGVRTEGLGTQDFGSWSARGALSSCPLETLHGAGQGVAGLDTREWTWEPQT